MWCMGHLWQVRELQEILKPILLRRKKEDVEKTIPQKEEVSWPIMTLRKSVPSRLHPW